MSDDLDDLRTLNAKLEGLWTALKTARASTADAREKTRLSGAIELPQITLDRIRRFMQGDHRIPMKNLFQETISNCTRGFAEIGATATESPGPIADMIKDIVDFAVQRRSVDFQR